MARRIFGYEMFSMEDILKTEYKEVTGILQEGIHLLKTHPEIREKIRAKVAGLWLFLEK